MRMLKKTLSIAKYPIALGILYYVLQQADWQQIQHHALALPPHLLLASFAAFTIAQLFAVWRMNAYYHFLNKPIDALYSLKLHYVALFYNIILPGGIGGDGYKVYLLKKNADYGAKEGVCIQLATRFNGLLILLLSIAATIPFLAITELYPILATLGAAAAALGTVAYFLVMPRLLKMPTKLELKALPYSLGVQGFNVLCMVLLWLGLSDGEYLAEYILLFQLAALAGMIPITIGGLGLREFTFYFGTAWLNTHAGTALDGEMGIVISLLVFAITAISALIGLIWLGKVGTMNPRGKQAQSA